jgi:hypothetical protein
VSISRRIGIKPHLQKQWVIPPDANAAFVASMEDVLEVYQRPHDPEYPVVCVDETSKQLVAETRVPIAAKPGQPARHDYEYARNRTANLFRCSRRWKAGDMSKSPFLPARHVGWLSGSSGTTRQNTAIPDPDHAGDDEADRPPLTVFNQG